MTGPKRAPRVGRMTRFAVRTVGILASFACTALGASATVAVAAVTPSTAPSPDMALMPSGRQLHPQGNQVALGNLPMGAAATDDGRYVWTVDAGLNIDDVRIVDTTTGKVCKTLALPGATGGIALDSRHHLAYVSGLANSPWHPSTATAAGAAGNDVLVFRWGSSCGSARQVGVIPVPPPSWAPTVLTLPAAPPGTQSAWPMQVAVSPDGRQLLVALGLAEAAAVVNLDDPAHPAYVPTTGGKYRGYPFGAAILPGGKVGLITNEATGTVAFINMRTATRMATVAAGPMLSHPQGMAINARGTRAYVALANRDQVAVINLSTRTRERTLSVRRQSGLGSMPTSVVLSPASDRLFVCESGADAVSVFRVPADGVTRPGDWTMVGRLATASQPEVVLTTRAQAGRPARLVWVAARGLDVGANVAGPNPTLPTDPIFYAFHPQTPPTYDIFDAGITYGAAMLRGRAGIMRLPSDSTVQASTAAATAQVRPVEQQPAPGRTPVRANGPIRHVFFIVRENRSYDQMLGAIGRGRSRASLQVFGAEVTPNMHALLRRMPLLDNVIANSDASIQGHSWTGSATVPDYTSRNWVHNYDGRGRPPDFGMFAVSWPGNGFLFDQADRQHISYFNYGEGLADSQADIGDADLTPAMAQTVRTVASHSDVLTTPGAPGCYPSDTSIGTVVPGAGPLSAEIFDSALPEGAPAGAYSHVSCFAPQFRAQLAAGTVPALNYLSLTSDHTRGTQTGFPTPSAMVADSDLAVGQIVDLISHSSIWASSAIFVVEDDSQDGADHINAHRIPAFVISPYARRGALVSTRYDLMSVVRTIEMIIGMKPLTLNDANATSMYDAFASTPVNSAPFTAVAPQVDLLSRNGPASPDAALSNSLDLQSIDRVPQKTLDRIIWHSVHGAGSTPPLPGPGGGEEGVEATASAPGGALAP